MANIGTAERRGETVTVTDYYGEGMPRLDLHIDENTSVQEEAARRFTRYAKARRAAEEIARRLGEIENELQALHVRQEELESIIAERNEGALEALFGDDKKRPRKVKGKKEAPGNISGTRRYLSSDGYEILVGRAAKDNDQLTFHVARPYDLWLHAANYPGSHVIVLNPTRKEIPHRTVIEAAQLAAKFSQARRDGKVDVHYTQRKFLAKPKGAAPGLVRMSSFRTIIVEPSDSVERI
jgi:predicted ribosome quality control (RQC) complex YloA/Tae2 family protein